MEFSKTAQQFIESAQENLARRYTIQVGYYPHLLNVCKPGRGKFGNGHKRIMDALVKRGVFRLVTVNRGASYLNGGKTCHHSDFIYRLIEND